MAVVVVSTVIHAPSEQVWRRIGDFTGWHTWLPRITATAMDPGDDSGAVGSVRTLSLSDGSSVRERLVSKDDRARTLAYEFAGPHRFPVRRYVGSVRIEPVTTDGSTYVHWSGDFDADATDEDATAAVFAAVYTAFLAALGADATVAVDA